MNKSLTETDKRVSQRIRVLRKATQLSQTELGRAIGATASSFERQEEAFQSVKGKWLQHSSF
jgi:transcriptional regulator with XRE-family HTH domain